MSASNDTYESETSDTGAPERRASKTAATQVQDAVDPVAAASQQPTRPQAESGAGGASTAADAALAADAVGGGGPAHPGRSEGAGADATGEAGRAPSPSSRTVASTMAPGDPSIDAVRAMFRGSCYVISDVAEIGAPVVEVAPSFDTLTGYTPSEALGRNLGFLQHADTDQEGLRALREAQRDGEPCTVVVRAYRRDGALFWCEQQHFPVPASGGRVRHYVTLLRDVSDRVHREIAERAGQRLAARNGGVQAGYDYTVVVEGSAAVRLVWISDAVEPVTGVAPAAVREAGLQALVHADDWARVERRARRLADEAREHGRVRRVDDAPAPDRARYRVRSPEGGAPLWVDDTTSVAWMAAGGFHVALHGRVQRAEDPPTERDDPTGRTDALTGLPDRGLLLDRLQQAMYRAGRSGEHLALALFDLQTFGFVNATFGRTAGDRVLRRVAERFAARLRRSDTLGRVEGDTFGVVLPALADADDALPALEKLLGALSAPLDVADPGATPLRVASQTDFAVGADASRILSDGGATLTLSAVVGVATYPDGDVQVAGELYDRATAALAAAKRRGEHVRFYQADLDARMRDRIQLRGELDRAVRSDELVLHFQPRLSLKTGQVTSFEGLVRWAHPSRGLLKPAAFLADAEASPIGSDLFAWVLERGVAQARAWQERGVARRVAVNVGPRALAQDDFVERVSDALARHDLHPSLLELELVEGTEVDQLLDAREALAKLRSSGVRIALDDVETAFGSLAKLEALPLDSLTIDRAVMGRLRDGVDGDAKRLIAAMVALGRSLRLNVIAEGVETIDQERLVRELACDEVQGFLHGKALPAHLISPTGEPLPPSN